MQLVDATEQRTDWTPQRVHLWLLRYQELVVVATTGTVRAIIYDDHRTGEPADPHRLIDIKADIDRALLQLQQIDEDPIAAMWIRSCYLAAQSTADVAEADSVSQRWVQMVVSRGRHRMAEILGYTTLLT